MVGQPVSPFLNRMLFGKLIRVVMAINWSKLDLPFFFSNLLLKTLKMCVLT